MATYAAYFHAGICNGIMLKDSGKNYDKLILELWLPKFRDSIFYASLLFPMCLFESKTAMLINTYLKALRKERWLCLANIITVGMSFILSVITVYILKNLLLTVLLIPVLFSFRCLILEYPLAKC